MDLSSVLLFYLKIIDTFSLLGAGGGGMQFRPKFTITADLDSKYVLDNIQLFLNCGKVTINKQNYTAEFEVVRLEDLNNIIIPLPPLCGW